ncbi:MAG: radical SAM protein [Nanoarchaeota archaeon]
MDDDNKNFVNLTYKCNNNCISCVMENHYQNDEMLTFEFITKQIDRILDRSKHIEFNGGEPTIRKDIFEILDYTKNKKSDVEIGLITNARLFSDNSALEKLAQLNLNKFKVMTSIYGHDSFTHNAITRTPNSFKQQMLGIKNLISVGVKVELRIIINKMNYKILPEIAQMLLKFFGPKSFTSVDFVNTKLIGQAKRNLNNVGIETTKIVPYLETAAKKLISCRFNVRLFHFPHCVLDANLRKFSVGVSAELEELYFSSLCYKCQEQKKCTGIWKSYVKIYGDEEFRFKK